MSKSVALLTGDMFFVMRIRTTLQHMGIDLTSYDDAEAFVDGAAAAQLAIVDFNRPVDWSTLRPVIDSDVPLIAFGSHTNVAGFRDAKAVGVSRVISNGDFTRTLPDLVTKYLGH